MTKIPITEGGCCVFHDIGLCTEDIVWSMCEKGRTIHAIKLLKDHGFGLKEAKDLVEEVIKKRTSSLAAKAGRS